MLNTDAMLRLKLIREVRGRDYTHGTLFDSDENILLCDTLEDKVRDLTSESKVYGETAIPFGTYRIKATYSPKFKKQMVAVLNVPHFKGIRLHWGRTAKNSLGCPLVGLRVGENNLENEGMTDRLVKLLMEHGNEGILEIV